LEWLWAAAERAGVPIAMLATDSLRHIGRIAERHPALRLTIDHLGGRGGTTTLKDAAAMEHMPELIRLAWHSNVAVKATGAPRYCSGPYRSGACTRTFAGSTTRSGRRACSGERTSRRCRAPGGSA